MELTRAHVEVISHCGGFPLSSPIKLRIRRHGGRWRVLSAAFTQDEMLAPGGFWEYWDRLSDAVDWCSKMNEDQAWEEWTGPIPPT